MSDTTQSSQLQTKEQIEHLLEMCFTSGKYDIACKILLDLIVQLKTELETVKETVRAVRSETRRF